MLKNLFDDLFHGRTDEFMKAVLDYDARKVVATISGYVAKKFIKRNSYNLCKQTSASQKFDLQDS